MNSLKGLKPGIYYAFSMPRVNSMHGCLFLTGAISGVYWFAKT